jgi:pimeloyl-ACP methyl ester carboxylesterase
MTSSVAAVNGIELCYETFGDRGGRPMLLIMGLSGPMHWWDDEFCELLAGRGCFVIRYDNRDCGRSTSIPGRVSPLWAMLGLGRSRSPYTLDEMADDAAGLLTHLGIDAAHVVGVSMGGMIAQTLAVRAPERVLSLVSISSTTGSRLVGRPSAAAARLLMSAPPRTRDAYLDAAVRMWRLIGSPGHPFDADRVRRTAERTYEWGLNRSGTARQLAAILVSGNRTRKLRSIRVPTLVIHGDADPLIHVSGGRATVRAIPGAELRIYPGMGHDLPPKLWPDFAADIVRTMDRAGQ